MAQNDDSPSESFHPFSSFIPGKITGKQAESVMTGSVNPFTGEPFSSHYVDILKGRQQLPVYLQMNAFYEIFSNNQVMVITGEPGSGKTTQIPQFIVYSDLPHIRDKMVACTQPRRVAAMSVAKRVAEEMDVKLGQHVGYTIRFEDMTEPGVTFLKYMTDGVLLREAMNDPLFSRYSTIILDEANERTVATDILMVLLKDVLKKRADLKLVILSATLGAMKFQKYLTLGDSKATPLFQVPGRTFPVEILYTQEPEADFVEASIRTVMMIHQSEEPGDILLFLAGEEQIEEACQRIRTETESLLQQRNNVGPLSCIPLYSPLSYQQQQRIFDPPPPPLVMGGPMGRKVVVATSIAETSLTIHGIVYVIDPGFSRQRVYNPLVRVESLLDSPISKASANQRAARAGCTRPGKCFRLYTEQSFVKDLKEETYPEIMTCNLTSTVLELIILGIKDLVNFDYLDRPAPETLMRALEVLHSLAAIEDNGELTALGGLMASFPVDPQLAKFLIVSPQFSCSHEALSIVAMLSVPNIWFHPRHERKEAEAAKAHLSIPDGDHLTLLNVYTNYVNNLSDRDWPQRNFLSAQALAQAADARNQLLTIMERNNLPLVSLSDQKQLYSSIKHALVCGFPMQVAYRPGEQESYLTVKDHQRAKIHPSSSLNLEHEWVIFHEIVLTSSLHIRTVTAIEGRWLLEHAYEYYDPSRMPNGDIKSALLRLQGNPSVSSAHGSSGKAKEKKAKRGRPL